MGDKNFPLPRFTDNKITSYYIKFKKWKDRQKRAQMFRQLRF